MQIKDIFFPMLSGPEPTEAMSIERAVSLAASLGAHISGLALEFEFRSPVGLYAHPVNVGGILAAERRKSASHARDLIAAFHDAAAQAGVLHEYSIERCAPKEIGPRLVSYARLRDLSVVPVNIDNLGQRLWTDRLILESGRSVLLLPENTTRELATRFETIVVAWDGGRSATRAVADALPFLQAAKRVFVVTVVDEKPLDSFRSGVELCKHLARHGVQVTFDELRRKDRQISEVLEAHMVERNADLLVMGAYGHSRLKEFVMGGVTESVLSYPFAWTLLSN